jgi:STE24 endopeptidase
MNFYLVFILTILIGSYVLEVLVEILNIKNLKTDLPEEFAGYYDAENYQKSQQYLKENTWFGIITEFLFTPLTIAFILLGGFNYVDSIARSFNLAAIPTGLIFAGILLLLSQLIHIPFSAYATFVIEEKYGFNRTTVKTFLMDILKSWLLMAVIGGTVFSIVLWFFEKTGTWAWLYCWGAMIIIQLFLSFIAPVVIMPIFNKFYPLE